MLPINLEESVTLLFVTVFSAWCLCLTLKIGPYINTFLHFVYFGCVLGFFSVYIEIRVRVFISVYIN